MANIQAIAAYICMNYPYPSEISEARLVKMMYLGDWRSAILHERQISEISWRFHHYGPYTPAAVEPLTQENGFTVVETTNIHGKPKRLFQFNGDESKLGRLTDEETSILDFVIDSTKTKTWNGFIALVYGTYPIRTQPRFSELDLVSLAKDYRDSDIDSFIITNEP